MTFHWRLVSPSAQIFLNYSNQILLRLQILFVILYQTSKIPKSKSYRTKKLFIFLLNCSKVFRFCIQQLLTIQLFEISSDLFATCSSVSYNICKQTSRTTMFSDVSKSNPLISFSSWCASTPNQLLSLVMNERKKVNTDSSRIKRK